MSSGILLNMSCAWAKKHRPKVFGVVPFLNFPTMLVTCKPLLELLVESGPVNPLELQFVELYSNLKPGHNYFESRIYTLMITTQNLAYHDMKLKHAASLLIDTDLNSKLNLSSSLPFVAACLSFPNVKE